MMRRAVFLLCLLSPWATDARAWEDDELHATVEFGYRSRQLERGVDFAGHGGWGRVEISAAGWRGEAELFAPFDGGESRNGTLSGEYRRQFANETRISLLAAHRRFSGASGFGREHSTEIGIEYARAGSVGLNPSLSYRRDLRLRAHIAEFRLGHSYALTKLGAFLDWGAFVGWMEAENLRPDAPGPRVGDGFGYGGVDARLPYRIGERTMLVANAEISGTNGANALWSPRGRGDGLRASFGLSVTFDF